VRVSHARMIQDTFWRCVAANHQHAHKNFHRPSEDMFVRRKDPVTAGRALTAVHLSPAVADTMQRCEARAGGFDEHSSHQAEAYIQGTRFAG
jgi:hypothetical protein